MAGSDAIAGLCLLSAQPSLERLPSLASHWVTENVIYHAPARGRRILVLPGWGMPVGLFDAFLARLPEGIEVGFCAYEGASTAEDLDERVRSAVAEFRPDILLAWSLGALAALRLAALPPQPLRGLVLFSGFASFVPRPGHPHGWDPRLLRRMKARIADDPRAVLQSFAGGLVPPSDPSALAPLLSVLQVTPLPSTALLCAGLSYLAEKDALATVRTTKAKVLLLQGSEDRITPVPSFRWLESELGERATSHLIPDAAHAVFHTHPAICAELVSGWLLRIPND